MWLNERVPDLLRERAAQRIDEGQHPDLVAKWLEAEGMPPTDAEQFIRDYLKRRSGNTVRRGLATLTAGTLASIFGYLTFVPGKIAHSSNGFPLRDAPYALALGLLMMAGGRIYWVRAVSEAAEVARTTLNSHNYSDLIIVWLY